jgi:hypothetical protein
MLIRRTVVLSIFLVLSVSLSIFFWIYTFEATAWLYSHNSSARREKIAIGAWIPPQLYLERMHGDEQLNAIHSLLSQGFNEYYFVLRYFNNTTETKAAEELLKAADNTDLKIIIILLPLAEGGTHASYDWKGWMLYFNTLKEKHQSFVGFAIDDFNAIVKIRRIYLMNNMDLMILSNFSSALSYKRDDVQFYPVMYIETGEFETLKKEFDRYYKGIILVSTLYSNISHLENDLANISKNLDDKSIKFIVYPTKSGFQSSADRLIMATLSIASRWADGIIIYRNTTNAIVQDYLCNHNNAKYMSAIGEMERLQVKNEIIESRRDIVMCTFCLYEKN